MADKNEIAAVEILENRIFTLRGVQGMLDSDLAQIYGVETKSFNRAVKRNVERFPEAFRFQLTKEEYDSLKGHFDAVEGENLRCQSGTSKQTSQNEISSGHGGRRYLPYVFTEQGVSMLSAVLRSETAVKVSIQIINAFVEMRRFVLHNANIFARLDSVERRQITFESEMEKRFITSVHR